MKIPTAHEAEIRRILSRMSCPRRAECCDPDIEKSRRVHCLGDADLIECLDSRGRCCPLGLPFGYAIFCQCPVRKYLARHDL